MFSYDERGIDTGDIQATPPTNEPRLAEICRHIGRVIVGFLTIIIVIELAVKYWGAQP